MAEHNLAPTWVATASFGFLTLNSGLAIYSARGDPASVLFVVGSYLALLLLFRCLRAYERAPPGSPERERARRAVWPLTTLLTAAFSSPRAGAAGARHPLERQVAPLMMAAFGAMACDSALTVHDAGGGDVVSAAAVLVAYAALLALTFRFLRAFAGRARGVGHGHDDEDRGVTPLRVLLRLVMAEGNLAPTRVTTAGFGFLTLNSGLAIYSARGDPASVLFVVGSYLGLLLLFRCLRAYKRAPPGSPERERARRAVWPLTTLLTAAFSSPRAGAAGARHPLERQVAALMMAAFGAMACDSALAVHDARGGDVVSAAAVLVAYAALLALTFRFLRAFAARARGVGYGQDAVDVVRLD